MSSQEKLNGISEWRFENTLSWWVRKSVDNLIESNTRHAEGKMLTLLEAIIPNKEQLKAAKDMARGIIQEVRTSAYQYCDTIACELAIEIDEAKEDKPIMREAKKLDYKYSRTKIQ